MKTGINILAALMAVLLMSRCAQDDGICVGSAGKVVTENRIALPFHTIEIFDNINLFLTYDTALTGITVEAGENLMGGISTEIDSGRLVLRNTNSCDWLRSFEVPVNVHVRFTRLDTVIFQAAGNITCENTWKGDSIYLEVVEGAGHIDLTLDVYRSWLNIRYGTTRLDARGKSEVTFISSQGYGPLHSEDLISKFTYVYTFSPNDVFVTATAELGVEIGNIGNVYYRGDPAEINTNIYGSGRLIKF